jgi:hypothetical protein
MAVAVSAAALGTGATAVLGQDAEAQASMVAQTSQGLEPDARGIARQAPTAALPGTVNS